MDAQDDETALKMLNFSRGSNPFLDKERCLLCNCERPDPPEADDIKFGDLLIIIIFNSIIIINKLPEVLGY